MANTTETKPKKPIWGKWWFWGIIVFIIIPIIAGISGNGENKKGGQEQQPSQDQKQSQIENIGLSEKKQKQIFFEVVQAEDRATKDAIERYPTPYTDHLQIGQEYQLSEETPLMPELEPTDPLAALQAMEQIPVGTTIKIIKTAMRKNEINPWYNVEAEGIGYGWINSIALIGQFEEAEQQQFNNQIDFEETLAEKYKKELAEEYNLTDEQLKKISVEGITKHWPMPKL